MAQVVASSERNRGVAKTPAVRQAEDKGRFRIGRTRLNEHREHLSDARSPCEEQSYPITWGKTPVTASVPRRRVT